MATPKAERLNRHLTLVDVYAFCTGAMFSSGFFLLPGIAFAQAGGWVVLAYLLSAAMVVPAMFSKAELSSAMPKAGGTYYFLDRSMGPLLGTVGGLGTWVAMGLKNTFALIGIGAYLGLFFEADITTMGLVLALFFTGINIFGAKETARLQRWLVYALVAILALFLLSALSYSGTDLVAMTQASFSAAPDTDIDGVLATVGLVSVSYAGLTKVTGIAEEVADPDRNILRGMALSLGTAVFFYTVGAFFLIIVLDADVLAGDLTPIATGAAVVLDWMPGRVGVFLIVVAALAAFASTANAGIMSASRYLLAMGRDHLVGDAFKRLGRFGTPTLAVVTTGGFTMVALLTLDVVSVAKLASAFQLLMFALVNVAVIVMREARIDAYDPRVRSPFYPWMQVLGIFLSLFLITEMGRLAMFFTLALTAVGVAWFFFYGKARVERRGAILHWFERLGRDRFIELERELRDILTEMAQPNDDAFDAVVEAAPVFDLSKPSHYDAITQQVSVHFATCLPLDQAGIATAFREGMQTGLIPIARGVALPHFRIPGLTQHQLVIVRAKKGVRIEITDGEETRTQMVRALFFLVSDENQPGQHLRILAKLASHIEHVRFVADWIEAADTDELKPLLQGEALRHLSEQLERVRRTTDPLGPMPEEADDHNSA